MSSNCCYVLLFDWAEHCFVLFLLSWALFRHHVITYLLIKLATAKIISNLNSWHLLVPSQQQKHKNNMKNLFTGVILVSLLILDRFQTLSWCLHCRLWTSKHCRLIYVFLHLSSIALPPSQNKIILYNTMSPLQNLHFNWPFLQ